MQISKVVIPVAGWGTRSLPATKNIPKEMLPVGRYPIIHHVVEELIALLCTRFTSFICYPRFSMLQFLYRIGSAFS